MTQAGRLSVSHHAIRRPQVRWLADGRRLHLSDGPIDLIIGASGPSDAVKCAYAAAVDRLTGLLDDLCCELPVLRQQALPGDIRVAGNVARRMAEAVAPFAADMFITPMAAVAGSVADTVLAAMIAASGGGLERAYVNNGGDIALHLTPGQTFVAGLVTRPDDPGLFAKAEIRYGDGIGGIATSGAPGRSFSLGIADAVTILAEDAASADAAATVVANAVDLPGDPRITRVAASTLQPDSDLGDRLVTRNVAPLATEDKHLALQRGLDIAERLCGETRIVAAALYLQGEVRFAGSLALTTAPRPTLIAPTPELSVSMGA